MKKTASDDGVILHHAWGVSQLLSCRLGTALFQFVGTRGGASSRHLHEHKENVFVLSSGILEIELDGCKRRLYAGQSLVVPRGVPHRMTFVTDACGWELYYTGSRVDVDHKDIIRLDPGWTPEGQKYQEWKA